jgi:hypothetical protein
MSDEDKIRREQEKRRIEEEKRRIELNEQIKKGIGSGDRKKKP